MNILKVKAIVEKHEGKMLAIASEEVMDREGEILSMDGWDLKNFKANPQMLWYHNIRERSLPIGRAEGIKKVTIDGKKKLVFEPVFEEITEFGRTVKKFFEEGFLNSFSVGFMPLEKEDNRYTKQELLEISAVPVPALPSAQIIKRSLELGVNEKVAKAVMGDDKALGEVMDEGQKEMGKKELGTPEKKVEEKKEEKKEIVPEPVKEEKKEEPKEEKKEEQKEVESKRAVPFESHEKAPDSRDWDLGAAVSRIKKWATDEGEKLDFVKYRKGFAWYDNEKVEDIASYKFPHHDIQGATMITVWRGVASTMALLLGADGGIELPEDERKAVYNHLKKHYEEFNKPVPEFRAVQNQVLKGLDNEIEALNENYMAKKLNKNLSKIKEDISKTKEDVKKIGEKQTDAESFVKLMELLADNIKNFSKSKGVK